MSETPLARAEEKLKAYNQEYNLLSIRLEDLLNKHNPNSQKTRSYKESKELIESSENRLKELERLIDLQQQRIVVFKKLGAKNMVFTPRDDDSGVNPPKTDNPASTSNSPAPSEDTVKNMASGGTIPKNQNRTGSETQNEAPTKTTYSSNKPKVAGDSDFTFSFPPEETPEEKNARIKKQSDDLKKFKSATGYGVGDERYYPYPSVFEQSFRREMNNESNTASNIKRDNEYEFGQSKIRTNPYFTPKKTRNYENMTQNVQFENEDHFEPRVNTPQANSFPNEPQFNQQHGYYHPQNINPPPNPQNYEHPQLVQERARDTYLRRLRAIPKFNGESFKELRDFIDIINTLFSTCNNQTEEDELYQHMLLQLRGEAKSVVLGVNNANWETIRETLLSHFSYLSNQSVLISQLENLHQGDTETLTDYAARARKLLIDRNATYNHLSEEQKREHNRIARRAFAKGVKDSKLKDRLLTRGASSLEDAIAYAIEAESDAMMIIPKSELFCKTCRNNGHREHECRRKMDGGNVVNSLVSALRSLSTGNNRRLGSDYVSRERGFSGRSPMPGNNNYRYSNDRNYNNRYNNNMNRRPYNPNNTLGDNNITPWSWNPNNNNKPSNYNRPPSSNGYNNNGNRNGGPTNNMNRNGQQDKSGKRPNQGNYNTMFTPGESSDQSHINTSSSEESEN